MNISIHPSSFPLQGALGPACPRRSTGSSHAARNPRRTLHPFKARGFTLLEVLVALVIVAIALAAATRTSQMATDSTFIVKQRLVAGWVAENRLARHRALRDWPDTGTASGEDTQGGLKFTWQEDVSATPNPLFRRVEVKVFAGEDRNYSLATLVTLLVNAK